MIPILPDSATEQPLSFPAALADRCVKCGLCLPQCPTYLLSRDEAESPRGRIALMQVLGAGGEATPGLVRHLEQCLACRRCEAVCPAEVPYGRLIDAARAELGRRGHRPARLERWLIAVVTRPRLLRALTALARLAIALRAPRWAAPLLPASARRLVAMLPPPLARRKTRASAQGDRAGKVALFHGCMGPALEPQVVHDSVRVLSVAGYEVTIPTRQVCCAALPLHAGDTTAATRLVHENRRVFAQLDADAIAFTASGCGATLREYGLLAGAVRIGERAHDVMELLARTDFRVTAPPGTVVALHEPCTQRNVVGEHGATRELLERCGARWVALPDEQGCCGAAGSFVLRQPAIADTLLRARLAAIAAAAAPTLVTTNVGCATHLRAGLRRTGAAVRVLHPVTLLAEWLENG